MVSRVAPFAAALVVARTLAGVLGAAAAAGDGRPELVASFAAKASVEALREADALLGEARAREAAVATAAKGGPLEAYAAIDAPVGRWLDSLLSGVRHALAAGAAVAASGGDETAAATADELSALASLEHLLSEVLAVQRKEPLFYWHGPKHWLRSQLRLAFDTAALGGRPPLRRRLDALAASLPAAASAQQLLSSAERGPEASTLLAPRGIIPALGLALGDEECGGDSMCDYGEALRAARERLGGPPHVALLEPSANALKRIRALLDGDGGGVFLSFAPGAATFANRGAVGALASQVRSTLFALGRESLDLLWLPVEAVTKEAWPVFNESVTTLIRGGKVAAYGVRAAARPGDYTRKLLRREPAPSAWLVAHDVVRPTDGEALKMARGLGVAVVAIASRSQGAAGLGAGASVYLGALAGPELTDREATALAAPLAEGLAVAARAPSPAVLAGALRGVATVNLGALRLLHALGAASRPEPVPEASEGARAAAAVDAGRGIEEALAEGRRMAGIARAAGRPSAASAEPPAVSRETLADFDAQRKAWHKNFNLIHKEDFFDNATMELIQTEVQRLWASHDVDANCNLDGRNRLGGYVLDHDMADRKGSLYELVYGNEQLRRWVSEVNGQGEMWPSDFPIELREYGEDSQGMMCHPDLQMYASAPKDAEFAFTVENASPCITKFRDLAGEWQEVHTRGNGMIMVRPNSAEHCVGPTHGGTRTILKFIYVGDFRKSKVFWGYTGNECDDSNPNRRMIAARREALARHREL